MMSQTPHTLTVEMHQRGALVGVHQFPLDRKRVVKLGRWPSSDIRIDDAQAARLHAILQLAPQSVLLRDMGSSTGCWLNGQAVETAPVGGGEELRIGEVLLRFVRHSGGAVAAVPSPQIYATAPVAAAAPVAVPMAAAPAGVPMAAPDPRYSPGSAAQPHTLGVQQLAQVNQSLALAGSQALPQVSYAPAAAVPAAAVPHQAAAPAYGVPGGARQSEPAVEKYDTMHLVTQMRRQRRVGSFAALAVGCVIMAGLMIPLSVSMSRSTAPERRLAETAQPTASAPLAVDGQAPTAPQAPVVTPPPVAPEPAASAPTARRSPEARAVARPKRTRRRKPTRTASAYRKVVVQSGDTLRLISMDVFGDKRKWRRIYEANDHILSSPSKLEVGQVLRVPLD